MPGLRHRLGFSVNPYNHLLCLWLPSLRVCCPLHPVLQQRCYHWKVYQHLCIDLSPVNPDHIYVVVDAGDKKGGIYRSSERGASWTKMNDTYTGGNYYQEFTCPFPAIKPVPYKIGSWNPKPGTCSQCKGGQSANVAASPLHWRHIRIWPGPRR